MVPPGLTFFRCMSYVSGDETNIGWKKKSGLTVVRKVREVKELCWKAYVTRFNECIGGLGGYSIPFNDVYNSRVRSNAYSRGMLCERSFISFRISSNTKPDICTTDERRLCWVGWVILNKNKQQQNAISQKKKRSLPH